jgi:hypothetical protein
VRGFVSELTDVAVAIKEKYTVNRDAEKEREQFLAAGMTAEAAEVKTKDVDFKAELAPLVGVTAAYVEAANGVATAIKDLLPALPKLTESSAKLSVRLERFQELNRQYLATFPETQKKLENWDYLKPIPMIDTFTGFLFGKDWKTASFWQDWYGVVPLFVGSLMVSIIALFLAVPLGVGAAIYINQFASAREQQLIKPAIEFISAIPSVVSSEAASAIRPHAASIAGSGIGHGAPLARIPSSHPMAAVARSSARSAEGVAQPASVSRSRSRTAPAGNASMLRPISALVGVRAARSGFDARASMITGQGSSFCGPSISVASSASGASIDPSARAISSALMAGCCVLLFCSNGLFLVFQNWIVRKWFSKIGLRL